MNTVNTIVSDTVEVLVPLRSWAGIITDALCWQRITPSQWHEAAAEIDRLWRAAGQPWYDEAWWSASPPVTGR